MTSHSSPNRIVWEYFFSLRRLADEAERAPSRELARQHAALAVIMSVTVVEVFMNLYFRVLVEERKPQLPRDHADLLANLTSRKSLEWKLNHWPKRYLDTELRDDRPPVAAFRQLKELRNSLVHFTSTHETIELAPGLIIHGVADSSAYDSLSAQQAAEALHVAEGFVEEVFRLAGVAEDRIADVMHAWAGVPPVSRVKSQQQ